MTGNYQVQDQKVLYDFRNTRLERSSPRGRGKRRKSMIHVKSAMLLLCVASLGFAQDRGTVRGTVSDPTGASVPDAIVTARNVHTRLTQTVRTGADGVYSILYLPVGSDIAATEKTGFRKAE